jgi:hypothetical protein
LYVGFARFGFVGLFPFGPDIAVGVVLFLIRTSCDFNPWTFSSGPAALERQRPSAKEKATAK